MSDVKRALDWIVPLLQEREIPFHVTGGFAAHLYGATRAVNDIDIDIPTTQLDILARELTPFIEYPPQRHTDSTWNLYVCTLNYHGQLVDLTGDTDAYVKNKDTGLWDHLEIDFSSVVWKDAFGFTLPLQNPRHLIEYKRKIKYDEEKHLGDIAAVCDYLSKQTA